MDDFRSKFFMALGEYNYVFGIIEEQMKQFINAMIDNKNGKIGSCITADMPFKPLYHALMSLYRLKVKDSITVKKFETALANIERLEKVRNKHIHAIWKINPNANIATQLKNTAKFGAGLNTEQKKFSIADINDDIDELKIACIVLATLKVNWLTGNYPKEQV